MLGFGKGQVNGGDDFAPATNDGLVGENSGALEICLLANKKW